MRCPPFTLASSFSYPGKGIMWTDCLKEECAWWDDDYQRCCVKTLTQKLSCVHSVLQDIRDAMSSGQ